MAKQSKSDMNPLGLEPVHGCAVVAVGMEITNAGGGFQDPLEVDTAVIETIAKVQIGDTIYGLLRLDCVKVRYQPVKGDEDKLQYVPIFRCTDATPVDAELGADMINKQRDAIARKRDEAEGKLRMFDEEGTPTNPLSIVGSDEAAEAHAQ